MPVLPVVNVTSAFSTDTQSSGSASFTTAPPGTLIPSECAEQPARLCTSSWVLIERRDGSKNCVCV